MLVPIKWLNQYVRVDDLSPRELEDKLIMSGSNTENITILGDKVEKVVVSKITKIEPHPDADKLVICQTDIGEKEIQIVTGAKNMQVGDYVPVALHGSVLADGTKIKKGKLRGQLSEGMFCSYAELGFNDSVIPKNMQAGLMILKGDYQLGEDIFKATNLDDAVIEFEITPNRPDCLAILGMARETAATLKRGLCLPEIKYNTIPADEQFAVEIKAEDKCPRYQLREIRDVVVKESPQWLQSNLIKAGMRPINNIVDITNYVLLEYGQPIHAFDYDKISGKKLIVRTAEQGETITTLDDVERKLETDMLLIADESRSLAIAGIMGGLDSGVDENTTRILIECANFNSSNIRSTSRKLALRSESSARFEKGISPELVGFAMDRVCTLVAEIGAGTVVDYTVDNYPVKQEMDEIHVRTARINQLIGIDLSALEMKALLERLECEVKVSGDDLIVKPPYYRLDLQKEIDFSEEIARLYGYDKLPNTQPRDSQRGYLTTEQKFEQDLKALLAGIGFYEILTYSFISPSAVAKLKDNINPNIDKTALIINPLGEEFSLMRPSLLTGILDVVSRNIKQKQDDLFFFDIGNIFVAADEQTAPLEIQKLALATSGLAHDFYTLKGALDLVFDKLGIKAEYKAFSEHHTFHSGRCAQIFIEDKLLGFVGEIHPYVADNFELQRKVYAAELDVDLLYSAVSRQIKYQPLPKFPAAKRDIAFEIDEKITHSEIISVIKENAGQYLASAELFDIYQGDQIADGKKSMAYALEFRAEDRTLVEEDISKNFNDILGALESNLGAELRQLK